MVGSGYVVGFGPRPATPAPITAQAARLTVAQARHSQWQATLGCPSVPLPLGRTAPPIKPPPLCVPPPHQHAHAQTNPHPRTHAPTPTPSPAPTNPHPQTRTHKSAPLHSAPLEGLGGEPALEALLAEAAAAGGNLSLSAARITSIFPFPLDGFQRRALELFLQGQSVVVCAPTGAGKTAIAEAAAVAALARGQRVIYTTPLKVLRGGLG